MDKASGTGFLNQLVNFCWTILCFASFVVYWNLTASLFVLFSFLALSLLAGFVPLKTLQLSTDHKFYEHLGVKMVRKFVQNGELINRLKRSRLPNHKVIKNQDDALGYLKTAAMYEKYHFICFVFFLLFSIHAAYNQRFGFFMLMILSNFLYNICPMLLQQYNRVRISRLFTR